MLRKLSKEIAECYQRAEECRRKAHEARIETVRADFLEMERRWLFLARPGPGDIIAIYGARVFSWLLARGLGLGSFSLAVGAALFKALVPPFPRNERMQVSAAVVPCDTRVS
jgi:hypothetical protein